MTKFEAIGRSVATIALTVLASATMLIGAVGPAQTGSAHTPVSAARIA